MSVTGQESGKASITIKISRATREHIQRSTEVVEPIDRTLRRLLGLRVPKGHFEPKADGADMKRPALQTTVRISSELHAWITKRAKWNESIDTTLRRLLGIRADGQGEAVARVAGR